MIAIFILLQPFICLDFESILEDVIRKQEEYYKLVSFKVNTLMFNDEFDYEERNNKLTHQWYMIWEREVGWSVFRLNKIRLARLD